MSLEDLDAGQLLALAQDGERHAQLLAAISSNPKTREPFQRLLKQLNPNLVIPELDAVDKAHLSLVKPLEDKVEALTRTIQERDIRERLERMRSRTQTLYKLSDEDMSAVEALMVAKDDPIPSYDAAARVYLSSRTSATPTSSAFAPPAYQMPEAEVWKSGIGNPQMLNRIALDEAFKAWNELRQGKVPGLGAARGAAM
jgi:hypothetical protein